MLTMTDQAKGNGGVGDKQVAESPLMLQYHDNSVYFRNIWIETL